MDLELRELDQGDGCSALSLGDAAFTPLKIFLKKEAKKLHKSNLARTFVVAKSGETKVMGYVTTLCTQISVQQFQEQVPIEEFKYKDYPAIKLARLAVNADLQGKGVGSRLVDFIVGLAVEHVMPHTGCRFLVVDSKPQSVDFYEKKGFKRIGDAGGDDQPYTTMFIDLHRANES